jgi:hypothetical protein
MAKRVERLIPLRPGDKVASTKPNSEEEPPLLSQGAAAKRMGIGIETLKALIASGTIFAIPVGTSGKFRKVPVAEVEKWRSGGYGDHRSSGSL